LIFFAAQEPLHRGFESIEFAAGVDLPENLSIDAVIGMPKMIADIGNLLPGNFGMTGLPAFGDMSLRFARDLQVPLTGSTFQPVFDKRGEIEFAEKSFQLLNRIEDIQETVAETLIHQKISTTSGSIPALKS
jgi:hypothetical protein